MVRKDRRGPVPPESRVPEGPKQDALALRRAVARWENEGGADDADAGHEQAQVNLGNAELVQLQLRVIALENLVTALLANAPGETGDLARAIAANISPRSGHTPHHLTVRAAAQMIHLLERARVSKNSCFDTDSRPAGLARSPAVATTPAPRR
jgi:hypothetical protein